MYRYLIRPLLFLLKPETIHHLLVGLIKRTFQIPGLPYLISGFYRCNHPALKRNFLGMTFDNPVGLAAGFDKNAEVYDEFAHFGFSFIEIGTVTPKAQPGNPRPRSFRLVRDKALINRMGFNNDGVEAAVHRLRKRKGRVIVGGNIGKNTHTPNNEAIDDYHYAFDHLYDHVDYLVVNLSCPNIKNLNELQDKKHTIRILRQLTALREKRDERKPILLKISPDLTNQQLDDVLEIFYTAKIDGIIATNTTVTRDHLTTPRESVEAVGAGGLSGAPLRDKSTRIIRYIHEKSSGDIPIIGVGGIMTVEDALEKLNAGATLIQIYTGFIYNGPGFVRHINKAITKLSG
ncbi:MAG TPA: quinone-dependent dihydroorotate dehydrogenase [Bacteroidales bacterium]|nr:quinone-dependent dihydroorotate dehydrogenase [Bacteroidales bacterium]